MFLPPPFGCKPLALQVSPLPFLCCTAFALEVLRADLCVDPATLATLTRGRNHGVIFPVTEVMTGN